MTASTPKPCRPRLRWQRELWRGFTLLERLNDWGGRRARGALGMFARPPAEREWILFQFYHWVLDDERKAFRHQLQFLRRYGDFISVDQAIAALQSPSGIGGRYFCVTFDDGFRNGLTNAAPVLKDLGVPAAFFLPTKYIGLDLDDDWEEIAPFYQRSYTTFDRYFEFLNWDECRELADAGFTLGSHTLSHARLSSLKREEAALELSQSKQVIEAQLARPCHHFCCPWGKAGRDFDPEVHPEMARELGYRSFLTTEAGLNLAGQSAFGIRRISTDPDRNLFLVRYCLFSARGESLWARLRLAPRIQASI